MNTSRHRSRGPQRSHQQQNYDLGAEHPQLAITSDHGVAKPRQSTYLIAAALVLVGVAIGGTLLYGRIVQNQTAYQTSSEARDQDSLPAAETDCAPIAEEADMPEEPCEEEQAILGDTTGANFAWPINLLHWPNVNTPIESCDLVYGTTTRSAPDNNTLVSSGIQILVPENTPVFSAASGKVVYAQGDGIIIETGQRSKYKSGKFLFTSYQHLKSIQVKVGTTVGQAQLIGYSSLGSGATSAKQPSLHFGVWNVGSMIGGKPSLASTDPVVRQRVANLVSNLEHPLNYMPVSVKDRNIGECLTWPQDYDKADNISARYFVPSTPANTPSSSGYIWPLTYREIQPIRPVAHCWAPYVGNDLPRKGNAGIDIEMPKGTPILAAKSGIVTEVRHSSATAGYAPNGAGNYVIVKHSDGKWTNYQHMSGISVRLNQTVRQGQLLGYVGKTGQSYGIARLHMEVTTNGKLSSPYNTSNSVNPFSVMKREVLPATRCISENSSTWMIVNKKRPLSSTYAPSGLTSVSGGQLRSEAASSLNQLMAGAKKSNINLKVLSSYRSYAYQKDLYNRKVDALVQSGKTRAQAEAQVDMHTARPGHSEHQTGLAADLGAASGSCELSSCFGDTTEGKWLAAHAHEYGFVIRYAKGKTHLHGYNYEPWHLRYVGTILAKKLHTSGKTMEEHFNLPPASSY